MGFNIVNNTKVPKIEAINEKGVFVNGERLNGVISYEVKSSADDAELFVRLAVDC